MLYNKYNGLQKSLLHNKCAGIKIKIKQQVRQTGTMTRQGYHSVRCTPLIVQSLSTLLPIQASGTAEIQSVDLNDIRMT